MGKNKILIVENDPSVALAISNVPDINLPAVVEACFFFAWYEQVKEILECKKYSQKFSMDASKDDLSRYSLAEIISKFNPETVSILLYSDCLRDEKSETGEFEVEKTEAEKFDLIFVRTYTGGDGLRNPLARDLEKIEKFLRQKVCYQVSPNRLHNPFLVFSACYTALATSEEDSRRKCRLIEELLNEAKINFSLVDANYRLAISVKAEDAPDVKDLAKGSDLEFWSDWLEIYSSKK